MTYANILPTARLLGSGAIVFGVLAAVAGISSALFTSSPATATPNTFATGSANLQIASNSGSNPVLPYGTSIPGASVTGLTPGESEDFVFWLKNSSTDNMELDLAADLANIVKPSDLDSKLKVKFSCDVKASSTTERDGDTTEKTLTTWDTDPPEQMNQGADTIPGRLGKNGTANGAGSDEAKCTMTTTLDESSTSSNTSASFDAVFTGTQVSGT